MHYFHPPSTAQRSGFLLLLPTHPRGISPSLLGKIPVIMYHYCRLYRENSRDISFFPLPFGCVPCPVSRVPAPPLNLIWRRSHVSRVIAVVVASEQKGLCRASFLSRVTPVFLAGRLLETSHFHGYYCCTTTKNNTTKCSDNGSVVWNVTSYHMHLHTVALRLEGVEGGHQGHQHVVLLYCCLITAPGTAFSPTSNSLRYPQGTTRLVVDSPLLFRSCSRTSSTAVVLGTSHHVIHVLTAAASHAGGGVSPTFSSTIPLGFVPSLAIIHASFFWTVSPDCCCALAVLRLRVCCDAI